MHKGNIAALWRYPVKSMQGEEMSESVVTERGLLGDRTFALLDLETGHIASAKHPRKWERLFECRAAFVESPCPDTPLPPIFITLPDGVTITSEQPDVDFQLSQALGRTVALVTNTPTAPTREANRAPVGSGDGEDIREEAMALAAPSGTFFDYAPLHIISTATLDHLRRLSPAHDFDVRRFRPNIVIASSVSEHGFAENDWIGRSLQAAEVRLQVIDPCPRCVVTTLPQGVIARGSGILQTVAQHNSVASATLAPGVMLNAVAGVYATALNRGTLRLKDRVLD